MPFIVLLLIPIEITRMQKILFFWLALKVNWRTFGWTSIKNKNKIRPPASNFEENKMRNKDFFLSGLTYILPYPCQPLVGVILGDHYIIVYLFLLYTIFYTCNQLKIRILHYIMFLANFSLSLVLILFLFCCHISASMFLKVVLIKKKHVAENRSWCVKI